VKVIFAPAAKLDLFAIGEHIGPDNPKRAEIFVEELIDHCYTLADMRRRYPLVPRYEHWGIRRCVHGNYLIFYRLRADRGGRPPSAPRLRRARGGRAGVGWVCL
jgi:toxin ParE1/3/4